MKFIVRALTLAVLLISPLAKATGGGHGRFGINAGAGLPLLGQGGINIYLSDNVGLDLDYGQISLSAGASTASLTVPDIMLKWHPFEGSFFIAAGAAQPVIDSKGTNGNNQSAEIKTTAMAGALKTGWMWGSVDGGFWFGIDLAYFIPFSPKIDISGNLPSSDPTYQDVKNQADKYGSTAFYNLTFARIGYLF